MSEPSQGPGIELGPVGTHPPDLHDASDAAEKSDAPLTIFGPAPPGAGSPNPRHHRLHPDQTVSSDAAPPSELADSAPGAPPSTATSPVAAPGSGGPTVFTGAPPSLRGIIYDDHHHHHLYRFEDPDVAAASAAEPALRTAAAPPHDNSPFLTAASSLIPPSRDESVLLPGGSSSVAPFVSLQTRVPGAADSSTGPLHQPPQQAPLLDEDYQRLLSQKQHSLDCRPPHNILRSKATLSETRADVRARVCCMWSLSPIIGIIVALCSALIVYATRSSNNSKFRILGEHLAAHEFASGWAVYAGWNASFLFLSAVILNFIQPAGGSGIAEVKAYLNGASVPNAFTFSTFLTKIVVTFLCVSASMPIGSQGPMTHTGALVGGWLAQHTRSTIRRVLCCAGRREDIRDKADRPVYPSHHPSPSAVEQIEAVTAAAAAASAAAATGSHPSAIDAAISELSELPRAANEASGEELKAADTAAAVGAAAAVAEAHAAAAVVPENAEQSPDSRLWFTRASVSSLLDINAINESIEARALTHTHEEFDQRVDDTKGQRWGQSEPHIAGDSSSSSSNNGGNEWRGPAHMLPAVVAGASVPVPVEVDPVMRRGSQVLTAAALAGAQERTAPEIEESASNTGLMSFTAAATTLDPILPFAAPAPDPDPAPAPTAVESTGNPFGGVGDDLPVLSEQHSYSQPQLFPPLPQDQLLPATEPSTQEQPALSLPASLPPGITSQLAPHPDPLAVYGPDGKYPPLKPTSGCGPQWLRRVRPPAFDTDVARRDFVCIGAACGIAAAVTAPLAGTLLASYELCHFWSAQLGLRTLLGAVFASLGAAFCLTGLSGDWGMFVPRLYSAFFNGDSIIAFEYYDLLVFVTVGAIGGGLGVTFARALDTVARVRQRLWGGRRLMHVVDTVAVAVLWSTVCVFLPRAWPCVPVSAEYAMYEASETAAPGVFVPSRYNCPVGQHNPMADLMLVRQDMILKRLLAREMPYWFTLPQLAVFFFAYLAAIVFVGSTSVISGLIVPNLTLGAALGRFIGVALARIFNESATTEPFNPGAYAAIGAAAFVVGCTSNAFSYAVLMLEVMSDLSYFIPVVLSSAVAHVVASVLGDSIYTLTLARKGLPVLDFEPPLELERMQARHIMIRDPVCLGVGEPVGHVLAVLGSCTHNGFPVVFSACARSRAESASVTSHHSRHQAVGCNSTVAGVVTRKQLMALLARRVWRHEAREFTPEEFADATNGRMMSLAEVTEGLSADDLTAVFDIGPYMERTHLTVQTHFAADVVFRLFVSFSMRHLPVVDQRGRLAGMITRLELLTRVIQHRYAALTLQEARDVRNGLPSLLQRACARSTATGLRRGYYLGDTTAMIGEEPFAEAKLRRVRNEKEGGGVMLPPDISSSSLY